MTQKHTPGPWKVSEWIHGKYSGTMIDTGKDIVANVMDLLCADERPGEKAANAHLIAAAPEMLAALREIAGYPHIEGPGLTIERARTVARATIAKAEGGES